MGINGLLKKVKAKVWKISDAKGKRVAIDGFCVAAQGNHFLCDRVGAWNTDRKVSEIEQYIC